MCAFAFSFGTPAPHRAWRLAATSMELAVIATTALYFIPNIIQLMRPGTAASLGADVVAAKAHAWVALNWVRMAVPLAAWCAGLRAHNLPG